jgi:hypothetical protein
MGIRSCRRTQGTAGVAGCPLFSRRVVGSERTRIALQGGCIVVRMERAEFTDAVDLDLRTSGSSRVSPPLPGTGCRRAARTLWKTLYQPPTSCRFDACAAFGRAYASSTRGGESDLAIRAAHRLWLTEISAFCGYRRGCSWKQE